MKQLLERIYRSLPSGSFGRDVFIQGNFIIISLFNLIHNALPFFVLKRLWLKAFGIHLSRGAVIHRRVKFFSIGNISIGQNSTVNPGCYLDNRNEIRIGSNVSIAHDTKIYTLGHDIDSEDFCLIGAPVVIGDYACVFANVLIMPGVELGEGAVVYSGSVVTKSVAPYDVVGGNPARVLRKRNHDLKYTLNARYWFLN